MKQVLTIAVLILTVVSKAQEYEALRHCKSEEFKYDFYVLLKEKNLRLKDTVFYSWFRAQKIHHTQGQIGGDILDGPFHKYYHSGQLAEQGLYESGLRAGEWKLWRSDGTLVSIYNYSGGVLSGKYFLFDGEGKRTEDGKYRKGLVVEPRVLAVAEKGNTEDTEEHRGSRRNGEGEKENKESSTPPSAESGDDQKQGFLKRIFGKKEKSENSEKPDSENKSGLFKRIFSRDKNAEDDKPDQDKKNKREKSNPEKTLSKKDGSHD